MTKGFSVFLCASSRPAQVNNKADCLLGLLIPLANTYLYFLVDNPVMRFLDFLFNMGL